MADFVQRLHNIYDLCRSCALNEIYYGRRLHFYQRLTLTFDIVIFLGSAGSGISGWLVWAKHPGMLLAWGIISAVSILLAGIRPFLSLDRQVSRYERLFTDYCELATIMESVKNAIAEQGEVSAETQRRIEWVQMAYEKLAKDDDPRPRKKTIEKIQSEVNIRLHIDYFWYPHPTTQGEKQ